MEYGGGAHVCVFIVRRNLFLYSSESNYLAKFFNVYLKLLKVPPVILGIYQTFFVSLSVYKNTQFTEITRFLIIVKVIKYRFVSNIFQIRFKTIILEIVR